MIRLLNYLICSILKEHGCVVNIAMKQRSKFEGWLKLELAHRLSEYFDNVELECLRDNSLVDVYAGGALIELKTPNTNYRADHVDTKTRPITNNIDSIIKDINKLQGLSNQSEPHYIAFVMFPIDSDGAYKVHVNRIKSQCKSVIEKEVDVCGIRVLVFTASC